MSITQAESHVMEALWIKSPLTVEEVLEAVAAPQGWGEATVKTLINRLLKRKAIESRRIDGRVRYVPIVSRAEYLQSESQGLLDRLFGGSLTPLVAHFAKHRSLSPDEVRQLKQLIAELDDAD
ncbi:MAG: BlaI/MecI/CopY family transcriptional regulator [Caulobacter sp.]